MSTYVYIGAAVFVLVVVVIELIAYALALYKNPERGRVRRRLKVVAIDDADSTAPVTSLLKTRVLSEIPWLNRILTRIPGLQKLDALLEQADIRQPLGFFVLLTFLCAALGFLVGLLFFKGRLVPWLLGGLALVGPYLYILIKRERRMAAFERQFPDALDLMARALKAGHSLNTSFKLVADEFDEPIGREFEKVFDEVNFGVGLAEALNRLRERIINPDLDFFVVAVVLQRETGGNLAEIIENIARLIRERFKLRGQIKALAAEGKLSALVLVLLPFFMFLILRIVNPKYVGLLFSDPIGRPMVAGALVLMVLGVIVMKRMIDIRV
ncbi:MAG: type II secretion system F family protein [Desulfosoma sp.]